MLRQGKHAARRRPLTEQTTRSAEATSRGKHELPKRVVAPRALRVRIAWCELAREDTARWKDG
jgi:hypothetical protein